MSVEPGEDDVEERVGPLEVHGVTGAGDDGEVRARDRVGEPLAEGDELGVEGAGDDERGDRQGGEPVPERELGAGPGASQTRRQTGGGVAAPVGSALGGEVEPGEEGLRQPLVDEGVDADGLDAEGKRLVGRAPRFTLPNVVHAPRRADQDETADGVRSGKGGVQAQPSAHGVAHVGRSTTGGGQPRTAVDKIQIKLAGGTVSRRVQRKGFVVGTGHATGKFVPGTSGLGEPVDEDEPGHE